MDYLDDLIRVIEIILNSSLLVNLLWVIFLIFLVLIFKSRLAGLIDRIKRAKGAGLDVEFSKASIELPQEPDKPPSISRSIYWVGHDIMYTMDVILRGGANADILHGLKQSFLNAKSAGLQNYGEILEKLHFNIQTNPKALSNEDRVALLNNLHALRMQIGKSL